MKKEFGGWMSNKTPVLHIGPKLINRLALIIRVLFARVVKDGLPARTTGPIHAERIVTLGVVVSCRQDLVSFEAERLCLLNVSISFLDKNDNLQPCCPDHRIGGRGESPPLEQVATRVRPSPEFRFAF